MACTMSLRMVSTWPASVLDTYLRMNLGEPCVPGDSCVFKYQSVHRRRFGVAKMYRAATRDPTRCQSAT